MKNGRGEPTTHTPIYTIDNIEISSACKEGFSEKITEMRLKGHSSREISTTLGIGKTTVLSILAKNGISTNIKTLRQQGMHIGATPFGYVVVQGKLVPDPREQKIVQMIMAQWKLGKSFTSIAKNLNAKKISTRNTKSWHRSVINSIVKRHQK